MQQRGVEPPERLLPAAGPHTLALLAGVDGVHRYAAAPRHAGRAPELEDDEVLVRLGGFIGRLHAVGARRGFTHRHVLQAPRDARTAVKLLADGGFVDPGQQHAWSDACAQAIERIGPTRQMQSGYDRVVSVIRAVARGTVEESAVKRLKSRISVDQALREGLKKYPRKDLQVI